MELCVGTLRDFLKDKYQSPMPSDMDALQQMAAGVHHIHSNNLVHRDLKPENILISNSSNGNALKIADFGFCKGTTERGTFSLTSGIKGTFHYLAPELLSDNQGRGTTKSDIFALGCVFYELLTRGAHPFGNDLAVTGRILKGEFSLDRLSEDHYAYSIVRDMILHDRDMRPTAAKVRAMVRTRQFVKSVRSGTIQSVRCYDDEDSGRVLQSRFHPFQLILACALDGGRVCIFRATNSSIPFKQWQRTLLRTTTTANVWCIEWSVDGSKLAAGCWDGTVVVWEVNGQKSLEMKKHSELIDCIRWNMEPGNGHLFVTGSFDKKAMVWDSDKRTALEAFEFHDDRIYEVTWMSPDCIASCSKDKTIQICQMGRSAPVRTFHHENSVNCISWMEEDQRLASCSGDGTIKIWSVDQNMPIQTLQGDGSQFLCFDWHRESTENGPNWRIAAGTKAAAIYLFDLKADGTLIARRQLKGHAGPIWSVAFSPDGQLLTSSDNNTMVDVNSSAGGGQVIVWNAQTSADLFRTTLNGFPLIFTVNWYSTGTKLAVSGCPDQVHVIEFD